MIRNNFQHFWTIFLKSNFKTFTYFTMKIKFNFLFVSGILIVFALVQFSCSSSRKSAVPCPDFSNSRNMKRSHVQLNYTRVPYICEALAKIT